MKNVLVAVVGASPQVLTETLYALHTQGKSFPEEVYVITTLNSKELLVEGLFARGHWQHLIDEYQLPDITFNDEHIWVISDSFGNQLEDAKGEKDQAVMADFITRKIAELTADSEISVHASIAGGRKTMAFYMGYAMSLYGREQDSLSHVFVDDEFEFIKDFYFPTRSDNWIEGKKLGSKLNTKNATVTLAEIPFVRMRKQLNNELLSQFEEASFSKTVARMNAAQHPLNIQISYKARTLSTLGVDVKLSGRLLAMYLFMLSQPNRKVKISTAFLKNTNYSIEYLTYFHQLNGDVRVYNTFGLDGDVDWIEKNLNNLLPMETQFIQTVISHLHKQLEKKLPSDVVERIKVHSDGVKGGSTYSIDPSIEVIID
ncbi:CRISPR-associated ring nuclease Csm6 [Vibrio vulnificus]|uniref:CRISPR-associated ring nuclease Csm6 n=1 Tax=Vibrio vulnificus TaxID=672 RepID=UPI001A25CD34|nr:CRISPR-associated ring nuclease Csm6 [Vibrio vulnificus]MCA0770335.1 TIGR02584 family CRISPR-associated protein [Vibrio vulnificus]HAS6242234.1 TIGR02584 family CRISPR-associated protein [Vibrio vulnificus]HDY7944362.1 TIGR02584 family CRISPR-associated protein [Vibrio vulnificus]